MIFIEMRVLIMLCATHSTESDTHTRFLSARFRRSHCQLLSRQRNEIPTTTTMSQDCPICLNTISNPWVVCSPCGHPLHDHCRQELVDSGRGGRCPVCNANIRRFVKVYMDLSSSDSELVHQLETNVRESKELIDCHSATITQLEEMVSNLWNEMEKKDDLIVIHLERVADLEDSLEELEEKLDMKEFLLSEKSERVTSLENDLGFLKTLNDVIRKRNTEVEKALSNAQHAHDEKNRELKALLDETETDLQRYIKKVTSLKQTICQLRKKLQERKAETLKATRQANALAKTLKKEADVLRMENELLHGVILATRFLFSFLEMLLLFLWIYDYGGEEEARHIVLSMLTGVVCVLGLLLDSGPAMKTLMSAWVVMTISFTVVSKFEVTN